MKNFFYLSQTNFDKFCKKCHYVNFMPYNKNRCLNLECSFLELRCKEVVNVVDGKRLGHIVDIVFDVNSCQICGLILPQSKGFWNVFKNGQDIFIPFSQICKIGEDTILVELYSQPCNQASACYKK